MSRKGAMAMQDSETRLAAAAFKHLATESWQKLTLASVARTAKVPWARLLAIAPSKPALLGVMLRELSAETAQRYKPDRSSQSARERVLDVAMTWFEVQQSRKRSIRALHAGLRVDPLAILSARREILAAAEWILALAEADMGSARLKAASVAGILLRAMGAWFADDDLEKTMAQLDRDLRRIERFLWPQRDSGRSRRDRRGSARKPKG